jgi:TolB-like protein
VVGGCTAIGILVAWVIHTPGRMDPPSDFARSPSRAAALASESPSLWVLAIGVSHYQDPQLNLRFADADARAVVEMLLRQRGGPVYRDVQTALLINGEVTRESILNSLERFLGRAGPDDVVVIFIAGHGVSDRASGSYYFLPFPATASNLVTAGLRISDFDEMIRVVRRNVRGVVMMLDTCHAGALRVSLSELLPADDAGARLSAGEGFFLLAATKPGEDSHEEPEWDHGAFTYAVLEGLDGAADGDGDGLISVSDLFGYVAREVPRLTDGTQHPYHKMEGTDLVLAAVRREAGRALSPVPPPPVEPTGQVTGMPNMNTIGVMEFRDLRGDPQHEWIGKAVRIALNTELSKVRALRVYSPELIDRTAEARRTDDLATAQRLGIGTVVSGSFHVVGNTLRIDAEITDTATGVQKASDSVQGDVGDFFALEKKLVLSMLRRLPVEVSVAEGKSIENRTNTSVDAYRLLLEAEGIVEEAAPASPRPPATAPVLGPQSRTEERSSVLAFFLGAAYAADTETEVRQFLEEYRRAHELKDLDRLASLYVSFPPRQREALRAYLENADHLVIELTDIAIEPHEHDVAVSYTRRDHFVDHESGKTTAVEVRLTKILVRQGGQWRIAGGR